jgi:hypothetical protein
MLPLISPALRSLALKERGDGLGQLIPTGRDQCRCSVYARTQYSVWTRRRAWVKLYMRGRFL